MCPSHTETTESTEHVTVAGIECEPVEWNTDEPFLDPLEQIDPRVREWRQILRDKFNFNKRRNGKTDDDTDIGRSSDS